MSKFKDFKEEVLDIEGDNIVQMGDAFFYSFPKEAAFCGPMQLRAIADELDKRNQQLRDDENSELSPEEEFENREKYPREHKI